MATYSTTPATLSTLAAAPMASKPASANNATNSWFDAMAQAWGQALDNQANVLQQDSDAISNGGSDSPSAITTLTAESLKMTFLSDSSHTSLTSVGDALEAMARKQ